MNDGIPMIDSDDSFLKTQIIRSYTQFLLKGGMQYRMTGVHEDKKRFPGIKKLKALAFEHQ